MTEVAIPVSDKTEQFVFTAENVFRALADTTRLRCLLLIATNRELCVCELVHAIDMSQPKVSRHLKLLRYSGLVTDRRERIWMHYRIAPVLPGWVATVIQATVESNANQAAFAVDTGRLAAMPDRPGGRSPSPIQQHQHEYSLRLHRQQLPFANRRRLDPTPQR